MDDDARLKEEMRDFVVEEGDEEGEGNSDGDDDDDDDQSDVIVLIFLRFLH